MQQISCSTTYQSFLPNSDPVTGKATEVIVKFMKPVLDNFYCSYSELSSAESSVGSSH